MLSRSTFTLLNDAHLPGWVFPRQLEREPHPSNDSHLTDNDASVMPRTLIEHGRDTTLQRINASSGDATGDDFGPLHSVKLHNKRDEP